MPKKKAVLLHSADVHIQRFNPLIAPYLDKHDIEQVVHKELLDKAESMGGVSAMLKEETYRVFEELEMKGADAILITCSTLGVVADDHPQIGDCKILRIDNLLAEKALQAGTHIAIICAVEATMESTRELFDHKATELNQEDVVIDMHFVPNAWENFKAGDFEKYSKSIASYITTNTIGADVIALAQASMDKVPNYLVNFSPIVLSSPKLGVKALIDALR